jgi:hypothetical protein
MTRVISPAPEFTSLTEAEVMAALAEPDPPPIPSLLKLPG